MNATLMALESVKGDKGSTLADNHFLSATRHLLKPAALPSSAIRPCQCIVWHLTCDWGDHVGIQGCVHVWLISLPSATEASM